MWPLRYIWPHPPSCSGFLLPEPGKFLCSGSNMEARSAPLLDTVVKSLCVTVQQCWTEDFLILIRNTKQLSLWTSALEEILGSLSLCILINQCLPRTKEKCMAACRIPGRDQSPPLHINAMKVWFRAKWGTSLSLLLTGYRFKSGNSQREFSRPGLWLKKKELCNLIIFCFICSSSYHNSLLHDPECRNTEISWGWGGKYI